MGFTVKRVSDKGSQKGFLEGGFQKVPRTPCRRARPPRHAPCAEEFKSPDTMFGMLQSLKKLRLSQAGAG